MNKSSNAEPLYFLLISIHGLIRGRDLELGRDADTGGQTKYVVELAKALSKQPNVARVDLVTRRVVDREISPEYGEEIEPLTDNAQIVRITAGPEGYIRKEELWDHLDSFADNLLAWLHHQECMPNVLHSHYADAGYVGVRLAHATGLPLVHTGHSLGRDKRRRLLALGAPMAEIEQKYHISRRIGAEEDTLTHADLVITSTKNEITEQYELYDCYNPDKMAIVPPGVDLDQFHPPAKGKDKFAFSKVLKKFLRKPDKPMILALSRPDERKNIVGLLEAYGESPRLQSLANLIIVAGNRDDIREMNEGAQTVLTELLLVMDRYEMYGRVALPKHHSAEDVAGIYRMAAHSKGVFINPALTEPFGLTLLEAAASGLPLVATENGGPVDIIGNCRNGILVDPLDRKAMADALLEILDHSDRWRKYSVNGLQSIGRYYSWDAHAKTYLHRVGQLAHQPKAFDRSPPLVRFGQYKEQAIFTSIDNTLLGDADGLEQFNRMVREHRKKFVFGIATGRRLDSALAVLKTHRIPIPDILITSLGTEIYYAPQLIADIAWTYHIDHLWTPQVMRRLISGLPGLTPQPKQEQSRFKISYYYDGSIAPPMEELLTLFRQRELSVNPTLSFGQYLDIVPARASKGQAVRFIARQWNIPLERILVTGGSGGDEDMLRGNTLGVVVANRHQEELSILGDTEHVYFAERTHAWGILDAVEHYRFFDL